jgi:hypothetical protein
MRTALIASVKNCAKMTANIIHLFNGRIFIQGAHASHLWLTYKTLERKAQAWHTISKVGVLDLRNDFPAVPKTLITSVICKYDGGIIDSIVARKSSKANLKCHIVMKMGCSGTKHLYIKMDAMETLSHNVAHTASLLLRVVNIRNLISKLYAQATTSIKPWSTTDAISMRNDTSVSRTLREIAPLTTTER